MKVLFLIPYPIGQAPSQRFRFEQYFTLLKKSGIEYQTRSFLNLRTWTLLYKRGFILEKAVGIILGFLGRFRDIFTALSFDIIFVHREVTPIGPPIFEWFLSRVFGKKIIYDFDDAIWLPNTSSENFIVRSIKFHGKVKSISKWSWKVSAGNAFLQAFAQKYNDQTVLNPTTIDDSYHQPLYRKEIPDHVTIGWTGTHSTAKYLQLILPVIQDLSDQYKLRFLIISNQDPGFKVPGIEFRPWNKKSEIDDLAEFDIGLMPLLPDKWSEGKCGFKALQYLAMEIPALVSPVGVNKRIIEHGYNGYHCDQPEDWRKHLIQLIKDGNLRKRLGAAGRKGVVEKYSVSSNSQNFLNLFRA